MTDGSKDLRATSAEAASGPAAEVASGPGAEAASRPGAAAAVADAAERLAELAVERAGMLGRNPGEEPARRAGQLRDHLQAHVLPRARSLDAPLLVLLIGPTGAGKSSLLNTLAGFAASPSGVIRPTTRELVVLAQPGCANRSWARARRCRCWRATGCGSSSARTRPRASRWSIRPMSTRSSGPTAS